MQLVDSHCHLDQLDLTSHQGELAKALSYAAENQVVHMLCVCITLDDFPKVLEVAETYPHISASVGLHPNERVAVEPTTDDLIKLAQHKKIVAIGETGLDYYRSQGDVEWQRERFRQHIAASNLTNKPLIVHSRQAKADTLEILQTGQAKSGVLHCFTEDWEMAKAAMDFNFYISFSGIVTFKNAQLIQDVAKRMPLDRMLLETDSPYLAPLPYRGKPNEPAYIKHTAEFIANLRGIDVVELAEQTTENFFTLFQDAKR